MDIEALERLGRLRKAGAIGEEEFDAEKQRILSNVTTNPAEAITPASYAEASSLEHSSEFERSKRRPLRIALMVLLALVVMILLGVAAGKYFGLIQISRIVPSIGNPERYEVRSRLKHVHINLTSTLPSNPHVNDHTCSPFEKSAGGQAAKIVSSAGWHLTSEAAVGKLSAVAFVGACSPISRTSFGSIDGNVGLFDGEKLIADIYGKDVGSVGVDPDPENLQIKSGSDGRIIGTIIVGKSSITVVKYKGEL